MAIPAVPPEEDRHPQSGRDADTAADLHARRYGEALRVADATAAERVIDAALAAGMAPEAIQALVIEPAMIRIGELWQADALSVADEHLATAISQAVLVKLFDRLCVVRARSRERILLAAVEGQHHVLGLRMVADVLEGAGFDVFYLGADVPVAALSRFATEREPAVTGLAFGVAIDVDALARSIAAVHEACPTTRIMLGGRAVPAELPASGYPRVVSSMEVLSTVEQLLRLPGQPAYATLGTLQPSPGEPPPAPVAPVESDPVAERMAEVARDATDTAREYVRRARLYKDLAFRDPVTDLGNRRAFDDRLHSATAAGAQQIDGSLLMIDVDRFKAVNDTYGHEEGDRLLRLVGAAITRSIRANDFAARIGGDEFAVLLPRADLADARDVAARIGQAVAEDGGLTVSIGLAALCENARATVLSADVALYDAKAAGRDCVVVAAGEPRPAAQPADRGR